MREIDTEKINQENKLFRLKKYLEIIPHTS